MGSLYIHDMLHPLLYTQCVLGKLLSQNIVLNTLTHTASSIRLWRAALWDQVRREEERQTSQVAGGMRVIVGDSANTPFIPASRRRLFCFVGDKHLKPLIQTINPVGNAARKNIDRKMAAFTHTHCRLYYRVRLASTSLLWPCGFNKIHLQTIHNPTRNLINLQKLP